MSEKHKLVPAEQLPVAWARMKHGKIISVSHDKGVAEFLAGFAAHELVPLYMRPQPAEQPAPNAGECRKISVWAVYDAASDRKFIKMDASTGCLALFDTEQQAAIFASGCFRADYQKLVLCQCTQPPDAALAAYRKQGDEV